MNSPIKPVRDARRRLRMMLPALVLSAAACASTPPVPETSLQTAQQAIEHAERVEAGSLAAVELGEARSKLAASRQAVSAKKMVAAQRLADEARAAAELASAKSDAAKAKAVNAGIEKNNATLIDEMQRNSGGTR